MRTYLEQMHDQQEREHGKWLKTRPTCDICGEPIQEDHYYEFERGFVYCYDCFQDWVHEHLIRPIN